MEDSMKRIFLNHNQSTIVDSWQYEQLNKHKWYAYFEKKTQSYYVRRDEMINNKRRTILMHRQILQARKGQIVDHKNHDTLDNQKNNLRFCTYSQNNSNRIKNKNNKYPYKGISYDKKYDKWYGIISYDGKTHNLGCFKTAKEAALAYDEKAQEIFKEYAYLNFPKEAIRVS